MIRESDLEPIFAALKTAGFVLDGAGLSDSLDSVLDFDLDREFRGTVILRARSEDADPILLLGERLPGIGYTLIRFRVGASRWEIDRATEDLTEALALLA